NAGRGIVIGLLLGRGLVRLLLSGGLLGEALFLDLALHGLFGHPCGGGVVFRLLLCARGVGETLVLGRLLARSFSFATGFRRLGLRRLRFSLDLFLGCFRICSRLGFVSGSLACSGFGRGLAVRFLVSRLLGRF